jgi:hypothetical protein
MQAPLLHFNPQGSASNPKDGFEMTVVNVAKSKGKRPTATRVFLKPYCSIKATKTTSQKEDMPVAIAVAQASVPQSQLVAFDEMEEVDLSEATHQGSQPESRTKLREEKKGLIYRLSRLRFRPKRTTTPESQMTDEDEAKRLIYRLYRLRLRRKKATTFEDFYRKLWEHYRLFHGEPIIAAPPVSSCRWNGDSSWWKFVTNTLMSEDQKFRDYFLTAQKDAEYLLYRHNHPKCGYPFQIFWSSLWWKYQDSIMQDLTPPVDQSKKPREPGFARFLDEEVRYVCKGIKIWRTFDEYNPAYRLYRFRRPDEKQQYSQFYSEQWKEFLQLKNLCPCLPPPAEGSISSAHRQFHKFLMEKLDRACDEYKSVGYRLYLHCFPNQECSMDKFYQQKWAEYQISRGQPSTPGSMVNTLGHPLSRFIHFVSNKLSTPEPTVNNLGRPCFSTFVQFIKDETKYTCDEVPIWYNKSEDRPVYRVYRYLHPAQCISYQDFYREMWKMVLELKIQRAETKHQPTASNQPTEPTQPTRSPPAELGFTYHMSGFHLFMMASLEKFCLEFERGQKAGKDPRKCTKHGKFLHHCRPEATETLLCGSASETTPYGTDSEGSLSQGSASDATPDGTDSEA